MERSAARTAPFSRTRAVGVGTLALAVTAFAARGVVPNPPKADPPAAAIAAFLVVHSHAVMASSYLDALAVCLLVVATVGMVSLTGADGSPAGVVAVAGVTLSLGLSLVLDGTIAAATAHHGGGDPVALFRLADVVDLFFAVPGVVFMSGLGLVLLRSRLLPAIFGWAALAIGAIRVAGGLAGLVSGSGVDEGLFMLSALWTVGLGITLVARPSRVRTAATAAPVATL